ncbi:MAG: hypothetical protein E3K32_13155 [wastewater metagenome]|nr:hypothetical protein [Candidatus Loosdrechtia aerotolerans]
MFYYNYGWYKPQKPKEVKGGIKAQSKSFGKSWWAKRWIAVLESFNIGARLGRGRSYARSGQVVDISIESGVITARVQGSRPRPYNVTIMLKPLCDKEWSEVIGIMASKAIYTAKLLAGEMPQDIEEVFTSAKVAMFPARLQDIKTDCSCPDFSNPCKHIAAVYYIIGEEFDRDPFLIFLLRGMSRERLMDFLRRHRGSDSMAPVGPEEGENPSRLLVKIEDVPLDKSFKTFWQMGNIPFDIPGDAPEPPVPAAILKSLGTPPFWRGQEHFLDTMKSLYPCFKKCTVLEL